MSEACAIGLQRFRNLKFYVCDKNSIPWLESNSFVLIRFFNKHELLNWLGKGGGGGGDY